MDNAKTYLTEFFRDFPYEEEDAAYFLHVHDVITANPAASKLLREAVAAYQADIYLDYAQEIGNRADEIAGITDIHPYTVYFLTLVHMTKHLKALYLERGLDEQIFKDSVLDLKWKLAECKLVKGIRGTFVFSWFFGFFRLTRFALGRLQFEVITPGKDYAVNGFRLEKGKTQVINVHIPRTCTPLDKQSCDSAYQQARAFFRDQVGEHCPFVCSSWLLYPENKKILPVSTNTYRFMSEYEIIDWAETDGTDLWRLFDTDEKDPSLLPADSTMRRCYIEHLKNGGKTGWGLGIKF